MRLKDLSWLLCATLLISQLAFAEEVRSDIAGTQVTGGLTLDDVVAKALRQSPRLQAFRGAVAAAKGEQRQAGAWSNPELGIQAENVAGNGAYRSFDSAEMTYGVSQEFQIGGKIAAREKVASKGLEIVELERQAASLDVIRDVTAAYAEVVAAEESIKLATEQKNLAEDVLKSVSLRVGSAAAPLIQKSRAEVERSTASVALDRAMRDRNIAFKNLASLLGEEKPSFSFSNAEFYNVSGLGGASFEERLVANPDLVKLNSALEQSRARLDLEKANAIPDPRVNLGIREFRDSGDRAFVVGLSLPIPILNANQGNIQKARGELGRTEFTNRQTVLDVSAKLTEAQQRAENTYLQAETLKNEILPSAGKAFQLAREGYELGRFSYLEVLDAQRSLFGVKQQQIEILKEFHIAKAQVERLTAAHLDKLEKKGTTYAD